MAATLGTLKPRIKRWLPVGVWLVFIFLMSTGSFSETNTFSVIQTVVQRLFPVSNPHQIAIMNKIIRKGAHAFEYFILGLLLLRTFQMGTRREWTWRLSFFALLGVLLWAIGDEFHQSFVPTRGASIRDVAIDTTGGLLAQLVAAVWYRYFAR
jgi:VanZ family protein